MNKLTAIIAEDEHLLRESLILKLNKVWPELTIKAEAANGPDALEIIKKHQPDIAFLDIKMPGMSGIDVAEKAAGMCHVVFITAYDNYAVRAFEKEAFDYILKPVKEKRLKKTVERLKKNMSVASPPDNQVLNLVEQLKKSMMNPERHDFLQWIRAQHRDIIKMIPVEDVILFKSTDKYTSVITASGDSLIKKTIKELTQELDPDIFWRVHRSTIIKVSSILKISRSLTGRHVIKMRGYDEPITVSRGCAHLFKHM